MYVPTPVPQTTIDQLGAICFDFPEVYEESAWIGWRWMVRKNNFAHVLVVDNGYPPAYARVTKVSKTSPPLCVLTFRTPAPAAAQPHFARKPYFLPGWWPNIAGVLINEQTDWRQVAQHIAESYRTVAPKRLVALAQR